MFILAGEVYQARRLGGLLAWRGLGARRRKLGALPVSQVRTEERAQTILKCGCAGVRFHVAEEVGKMKRLSAPVVEDQKTRWCEAPGTGEPP